MNDIQTLRNALFDTLTALQDKNNPMDIDRAKAVCQVGGVIIDTARAEINFARVNGSVDTQFFHKPTAVPQLTQPSNDSNVTAEKSPVVTTLNTNHRSITVEGNVTTHRLK